MENLQQLMQLHGSIAGILVTMVLCSLRIWVAFFIIPVMSDQALQGMTRNSIALLLGIFVAYGSPLLSTTISPLVLISIMVKEAILGLILGFSAATVFWVAEGVGFLIDDLSGFNNVQVSNPMRSDTSTPTSSMLLQLSITAFWCLGGMIFFLGALYQSFKWWPVVSLQPASMPILESFILTYTDSLMQTIVKLATPMMLILIMVDFSFGFLAKGAEKIDTMSLSMPVKGAVTLLLLAIFVSIFVDQVHSQLSLQGIAQKIDTLRTDSIKELKNANKKE